MSIDRKFLFNTNGDQVAKNIGKRILMKNEVLLNFIPVKTFPLLGIRCFNKSLQSGKKREVLDILLNICNRIPPRPKPYCLDFLCIVYVTEEARRVYKSFYSLPNCCLAGR